MLNDELFESVKATIIDVLDLDEGVVIGAATTADDVEGWDSLQHVRILTSLEKKFGFRFADEEVMALTNVGDLVGTVAKRVAAKG